MRKKMLGSLTALLVAAGVATAGSASAGLPGTTATGAVAVVKADVNELCKTVFVNAATFPELKVTVGKETKTIDVKAIVATDVTVCVKADAAVLAKLVLVLDAPKVYPGPAVAITGYLRALAWVQGDVAVTVRLGGLYGTCKTVEFPIIPIGTDLTVPIFVAAGDP